MQTVKLIGIWVFRILRALFRLISETFGVVLVSMLGAFIIVVIGTFVGVYLIEFLVYLGIIKPAP